MKLIKSFLFLCVLFPGLVACSTNENPVEPEDDHIIKFSTSDPEPEDEGDDEELDPEG